MCATRVAIEGCRTVRPHRSQAGSTLLGAVIGLGVLGVVVTSATTVSRQALEASRADNDYADWSLLATYLASSVDCARTFAEAGVDPLDPAICSGTPAGRPLRLVRRTVDGSRQYLTAPLGADTAGRFDDWALRTRCDAVRKTLVVDVARPKSGGGYQADLSGRAFDWTHPRSRLFGGTALPLCYDPPAAARVPVKRVFFFSPAQVNMGPITIPAVSACFLTTIQGTASGNASCRLFAPAEAGNPIPGDWTLTGRHDGASQVACGATCLP